MLATTAKGKIGILGGSFNPIHKGHLAIAAAARDVHGLDRVLLMPAGQPPHKSSGLAPRHHRLRMVELACAGEEGRRDRRRWLEPCDVETRRDGVQYTVDSLREIRSAMPGAALYFIIGADSLHDFPSWREPTEILRLARLVVVNRPGYPLSLTGSPVQGIPPELRARIAADAVSMEPMPIESTAIRREAARGNSLLRWVPPAVAEYIVEQRLYRDEAGEA